MELSHSKSDSFKIFDNIASKYDFINSVLSFGLHGVWRRRLAWMMPRTTNMKVLDLATGTADVAIELVNNENVTHVDGLDMSKGMVEVGREKLASLGLDNKIKLHIGDAQEIPFEDNQYNAVSMSFGIRNVPSPLKCLQEAHRVLKADGRMLVLEFGLPSSKLVRAGHLFYLRNILPIIGNRLSGSSFAYTYLNETIETFPYGDDFKAIMKEAGFKHSNYQKLLFGGVHLYWGIK